MIDGGPQYTSHLIQKLAKKYKIFHRITSPHHPQMNGQMESTNKVNEGILTKIVVSHQRNWDDKTPEALWAYRTTWRNPTYFSPYELVYGKNSLFSIDFEIETLRTTLHVNLDLATKHMQWLNQLNEKNEKRLDVIQQTYIIQQQRAKWHDIFIKKKKFWKGDWAPLYDLRFKDLKGKVYTKWLGPHEVDTVFGNGIVNLVTIDSARTPLLANGNRLWLYHKPTSKDAFINIVANYDLHITGEGENSPALANF